MTQDEVIAIAKEAGGTAYTNRFVEGTAFAFGPEALERFASLVAARTVANIDPKSFMSWQEGYEAGVMAEREECVKVCDSWGQNNRTAVYIAEEIRQRGQA